MKRTILILSLLAVPALLSAFPVAFAAHSIPFTGRLSGSFTLPTASTALITGSGQESHLGSVTFTAVSTITGPSECGGFLATEHETTTAANGDKIFVSAQDTFCPTSKMGVFQLTVSATITGGTGRFADASGSATPHITLNMTSPNGGTFSGTLTGTISY